MLTDPPVTPPPPGTDRWRALVSIAVAFAVSVALAFVVQGHDQADVAALPPRTKIAAVPAEADVAVDDDWRADRCPMWIPPAPSPLDAIARASAGFAPPPDLALEGVAIGESRSLRVDGNRDGAVIVWTDRRVWESIDGGATWGRVLDAPGHVVAAHVDACGRVIVVRAPDGAPLVLGTRAGTGERWRALPAAVAGDFLGLAIDEPGAAIAIVARAAAAPGRDRRDAPAASVTTIDRGDHWSAPIVVGDVARATPVFRGDRVFVTIEPRGCPAVAPCSELRDLSGGAPVDRRPYAIDVADGWGGNDAWILAPASTCGAALACYTHGDEALAPVTYRTDFEVPPIARIVAVSPRSFLAIPAAAERDLIAIYPGGEAAPIVGSAGFPAVAQDRTGALWGLHGPALLRLGESTGVTTPFLVPGAPPPAEPPSAAFASTAICPAPASIRTASPYHQLWLVPLAVVGNERLGIDILGPTQIARLDPARARAAGAPALPHEIWILGAGDRPACRGVVEGAYAASDDGSNDSVIGAVVAGCPAELAGIASLDADPGTCRVANLDTVAPSSLPNPMSARTEGAYEAGDPRAEHAPTYVAAAVRIPDGRGYAHVAVDAADETAGDDGDWSSGWRWLDGTGADLARPEVKDDLSEAITAILYDATGPRLAMISGVCQWTIATVGDRGALSRRATRHLERQACSAEGNPRAAWLTPRAPPLPPED